MTHLVSFFMCLAVMATFQISFGAGNGDHTCAVEVPFLLERGRVMIPTQVNGTEQFKLILDSGMGFDGIILFHKEAIDRIDMIGAVEVRIPGAGGGEPSPALMIENGRVTFGDITVDSQRVIIMTGPNTQTFPSDGIIGWNLFGHYIVEVDYDKGLISLYDSAAVRVDSTWFKMSIELRNSLPFLPLTVETIVGDTTPVMFYIDLASAEVLEMLVRDNQKYALPPTLDSAYLGTGLSGDIYGHKGVIPHVWLGDFKLADIPAAFSPAVVRSKQAGADGVLGNGFMMRFRVIFDYPHEKLYFKPSKYFGQSFE